MNKAVIVTENSYPEGDAYSVVRKRIGSENADILFYENPKRILSDMDILNIEVAKKKKRFSFFRR